MLIVLIIGLGTLAAGAAFFFWLRYQATAPESSRVEQTAHQLMQPGPRNEPLSVVLYYPLNSMLTSVSAAVKRQPDLQSQARETLLTLLHDQRAVQTAVLRDVKLRTFFLDGQGTAYIDLTLGQEQTIRASAWDELLALFAMVDTLMQNFEDLKQVCFLVDGRDAQTLAGHLDLSRKYTKRMDLVR